MENLKKEIEKAALEVISDYTAGYFDKIIVEKDFLTARELFDEIEENMDIDVEEYLMDKACGGLIFDDDEVIPEADKAEYEKNLEEYKQEYEKLKKKIIKPIHQEFKEKLKEMREEYQAMKFVYIEYFENQFKHDVIPSKSKKVLSIFQKWRKPENPED